MNLQQLLAQSSLEDIVRTTMTVYHMEPESYQEVYEDYAKLIETLLKLEPIPSGMVLLGVFYEDEGVVSFSTTAYKADALKGGIAYDAILENTIDPAPWSAKKLIADTSIQGWPDGYSYVFLPWAEVMGYEVNEVNLEDVGPIPLLVDALYELTFFGFDQEDMEAERHILDESIAELRAIRALSPEEQAQHNYGETIDMDELWDELGLPPRSPEEKAQEEQAMALEVFRNRQRTYRALRKYGGFPERNVFEIQGCISTQGDVSHDVFWDAFIAFVSSKGWHFGGGTKDVTMDE